MCCSLGLTRPGEHPLKVFDVEGYVVSLWDWGWEQAPALHPFSQDGCSTCSCYPRNRAKIITSATVASKIKTPCEGEPHAAQLRNRLGSVRCQRAGFAGECG